MYETRCPRCRRGSLLVNSIVQLKHLRRRGIRHAFDCGHVRFCWNCGWRKSLSDPEISEEEALAARKKILDDEAQEIKECQAREAAKAEAARKRGRKDGK